MDSGVSAFDCGISGSGHENNKCVPFGVIPDDFVVGMQEICGEERGGHKSDRDIAHREILNASF